MTSECDVDAAILGSARAPPAETCRRRVALSAVVSQRPRAPGPNPNRTLATLAGAWSHCVTLAKPGGDVGGHGEPRDGYTYIPSDRWQMADGGYTSPR